MYVFSEGQTTCREKFKKHFIVFGAVSKRKFVTVIILLFAMKIIITFVRVIYRWNENVLLIQFVRDDSKSFFMGGGAELKSELNLYWNLRLDMRVQINCHLPYWTKMAKFCSRRLVMVPSSHTLCKTLMFFLKVSSQLKRNAELWKCPKLPPLLPPPKNISDKKSFHIFQSDGNTVGAASRCYWDE